VEKKIQSGSDRKRGPVVALAAAVLVSGYAQTGYAQISKGNWILINRGLQVQAMVTKDDVFHLNTYSNAYYTSIHWLWDSNPSLMGTTPASRGRAGLAMRPRSRRSGRKALT